MPQRSDDPLRKVTLNLYDEDCDRLKRIYGYGWSEEVRKMVRRRLREMDAASNRMRGIAND